MEMPLISYAHKEKPTDNCFCQYADDPLPAWAVNVKPYVRPDQLFHSIKLIAA